MPETAEHNSKVEVNQDSYRRAAYARTVLDTLIDSKLGRWHSFGDFVLRLTFKEGQLVHVKHNDEVDFK